MFSLLDGLGGNGSKAYHCNSCRSLITNSDRHVVVEGKKRHLFVNPAGVECDFYTFFSCPGAISPGQATDAHTWFPGYQWSLAFCAHCFNHLGWHYERLSALQHSVEFWGILCSHLSVR